MKLYSAGARVLNSQPAEPSVRLSNPNFGYEPTLPVVSKQPKQDPSKDRDSRQIQLRAGVLVFQQHFHPVVVHECQEEGSVAGRVRLVDVGTWARSRPSWP